MTDESGMIIILEGLDLSGKTTLAYFLRDALQRSGHIRSSWSGGNTRKVNTRIF